MKHFDLIVVGGGQAGCSAALAAARQGLNVLLAEAGGALGGAAVNCLVNPYMPFRTVIEQNGESRQIRLSDGIFGEIYDELNSDSIYGYKNGERLFHEESMKVVYDRKMKEAGVTVLFHATLCDVRKTDRLIESVSFATVGGIYTFSADTFIDSTGDATLAAFAECPFQLGRPEDNLCQPMTLCFRLGNVDTNNIPYAEIDDLYNDFQAQGKIKNPREDVLIFRSVIPGVLHFNTTRIVKLNPTDPFDRSEAEILAREQIVEIFHFLRDNFENFKNADLLMSASQIGVRESRMIEARYQLTVQDLIDCVHFPDSIAAGNYDIDIHSPDGTGTSHRRFPQGVYYTIPYRSLIPKTVDNMLVAGRCIGATHEAQASIRIMPICSCTGEAAGIAAAVAKDSNICVADADAEEIRTRLLKAGAFVG